MSLLLDGSSMNKRSRGEYYELLCARYLEAQGMELLAHSYRKRTGEIDLILKDGDTYVFTEVKYRSSAAHGLPSEAVGREKRRHIVRTSELWLSEQGLSGVPVRYDVAEVLGGRIRILKNAFGARSLM